MPGIAPNTRIRNVEKIAVIGAGTMGGGIAMNFLNAGIPVTILEATQDQIDKGLSIIRGNFQNQVDKGKLSADEFEHRMRVLTSTLDYADLADLADADLIIEAVFEDLEIKKQVFSRLDEVAKSGAILASNTSTLDLDLIAGFTRRPGDVIGMHFFSPAIVMKLLEVVRGKETADDVLATAMAVGRQIGKTAVVSGVCDGFIGNRMLRPYQDAAMTMLYTGATPEQIDSAIERFGFAMGPFRMSDLAGNDIGWRIRQRRHYAESPDMQHDTISDTLCEMGRYGQKTGSGWYDYNQGSREAFPSPTVAKLLADYHAEHRTQHHSYADDEIVERLVFALVDEGARILDEGIALRAYDIDVVYLSGCGFPRHRGGPMFYADTVGLDHVISALRGGHHADNWQPAPLLVRLTDEGRGFSAERP